MNKTTLRSWTLACLIGLSGITAYADVKLPRLVGNHMVLQRDAEIHLWGWADPEEDITVRFIDQKATTTADDSGYWEVSLDPVGVGGPFSMTVAGNNTIALEDILMGDVWVCSGQSNMGWPVKNVNDSEKEIAQADFPEIRLFTVPREMATQPQDRLSEGSWQSCSPETIPDFSAVAYFFGRELTRHLNVPIGLIHSSWGGTRIESWISPEATGEYRQEPGFADELLATKLPGQSGKVKPNEIPSSVLFQGMIHPLLQYLLKGVIWYQGEANVAEATAYHSLFPALIRDWRDRWSAGAFPFLFVQLANFHPPVDTPQPSEWAELREAQAATLSLENTGMAVTIDVGEADDIHPRDKQTVGHRLALAARHVAYGETIEYSGPVYDDMEVEDNSIRIYFEHADAGVKTPQGKPIKGFAIAGEDRQFVWADATIEGNTVVVSSEAVPEPVAVRYAWSDNPDGANLYNTENLPTVPFRTDEWDMEDE